VRKSRDDLALDRDSMGVDLPVKWLAEGDGVFCGIVPERGLIVIMEPKSNPVEEVKTCPVGDAVYTGLIVSAKKDGCCEDSLEALHDAAIMAAVFERQKKSSI
jgi:hypothetical protein